jgi:hypothetical protein
MANFISIRILFISIRILSKNLRTKISVFYPETGSQPVFIFKQEISLKHFFLLIKVIVTFDIQNQCWASAGHDQPFTSQS